MRIVVASLTIVVGIWAIACSDGNGEGPSAGGGGRSAAPSAGMAGSGAAGKGGAGTGTSSGPQLPGPVAIDLTGLLPTSGQHIVYAGDASSSASDSVLVAVDLVSGTQHNLNPGRANHYHKMVSPDRQTLLFSNVWAGGDRSLHVVRFTAQGVVPAKLVSGYEGFPGTQETVLYFNSHRTNWSEDNRFVGLWRNNSDDDSVDVVDTRSGRLQGALRGQLAKGAYIALAPRGPFFNYVFLEGMEGRMERSGYARITAQGISMPVDIAGQLIDFSPDGARLFTFVSSGEPPNERVDRVSVHELATGKETEIATSVDGEQLTYISLLEPDGRHLHGYYEDAAGKHVVRRIATDGSTPPAPLSDPALGVPSNIIISRDGSIALHFYAPDPSRMRYDVTDAAGTKRRNLGRAPGAATGGGGRLVRDRADRERPRVLRRSEGRLTAPRRDRPGLWPARGHGRGRSRRGRLRLHR